MCHTIRGHDAPGIIGPDLTHFGSRTTVAAGLLDNTPENLAAWISDPEGVKPGNIMYRDGYIVNQTVLSDDDVQALVAYLNSLK
jgi:cytochrome c oxidase subunit 2